MSLEEQAAVADWIRTNLAGDKRLAGKLDIDKSGANLYEKIDDGIILCSMVNIAAPGSIKVRFKMLNNVVWKLDLKEKAINYGGKRMSVFQHHENISLALKAMQKIGCVVVGIDSHTLQSNQGKKWLVLGLLWQIIKKILLKNIPVVKANSKTPESELMDWVNLTLEKVINLHTTVSGFIFRLNNRLGQRDA